MNANEIVKTLLEEGEPLVPSSVTEATVHLPPRCKIWMASFTGPEPGRQVWRSTGLTDQTQALLLARKWEAEARLRRMAYRGFRKPSIRVQHSSQSGGLTQREVAVLLKMSLRGVREVERRAFAKLRRNPLLKEFWWRYLSGELEEEGQAPLTRAEIDALFELARTSDEQVVIGKVLRFVSG